MWPVAAAVAITATPLGSLILTLLTRTAAVATVVWTLPWLYHSDSSSNDAATHLNNNTSLTVSSDPETVRDDALRVSASLFTLYGIFGFFQLWSRLDPYSARSIQQLLSLLEWPLVLATLYMAMAATHIRWWLELYATGLAILDPIWLLLEGAAWVLCSQTLGRLLHRWVDGEPVRQWFLLAICATVTVIASIVLLDTYMDAHSTALSASLTTCAITLVAVLGVATARIPETVISDVVLLYVYIVYQIYLSSVARQRSNSNTPVAEESAAWSLLWQSLVHPLMEKPKQFMDRLVTRPWRHAHAAVAALLDMMRLSLLLPLCLRMGLFAGATRIIAHVRNTASAEDLTYGDYLYAFGKSLFIVLYTQRWLDLHSHAPINENDHSHAFVLHLDLNSLWLWLNIFVTLGLYTWNLWLQSDEDMRINVDEILKED